MDEALLAGPLCSDQCLWTAEEEAKRGSQSKAGSKTDSLSFGGDFGCFTHSDNVK